MDRFRFVVFFTGTLVSALLAGNLAFAQCRGGGTGQGTTGTTGTTATGLVPTVTGNSAGLLTGQGSLAYDMMMAQIVGQQIAQRQMMLAMQQQQMRQEKLAARKYRAEQTRTQVAESRARTRAALAAKGGLMPAKQPEQALLAYQPVRR